MSVSSVLGTNDEGVLFGALVAAVFAFLMFVEYIRTLRSTKAALPKEQYANAAVWGVMLTMAAAGAVIAPQDKQRRDISILLTVGAALQLLAFALLWVAPRRGANLSKPRASADFAILMVLTLALRVCIEMKWNGYLPIDRTGDGCIQILEGIALLITLYGVGKTGVRLDELKRALGMVCGSVISAFFCYGELDGNPSADRAFALSIYMELSAWVCMGSYVKDCGRDAVNSMFLPPIFIQALCRGYFWFMASPETLVQKPVYFIQYYFNWILLSCHLAIALLALWMSVLCVREFTPALPHLILSPDVSSIDV